MDIQPTITFADIQTRQATFAEERNWGQFHSPKNLCMALTGEVGELNEIFQWKTEAESYALKDDPIAKTAIKHELADIFLYVVQISAKLDVDLLRAAEEKMALNAQKYPISKAHSSNKKYTEL